MKINVGPIDSVVRIFLGVGILFLTLMSMLGNLGYLSIYLIASGIGRTCIFYRILGINTNPHQQGVTNHGH